MTTLFEDNLLYAEEPSILLIGKIVNVVTKLGVFITQGVVEDYDSEGYDGGMIRTAGEWFPGYLYSFIPVEGEKSVKVPDPVPFNGALEPGDLPDQKTLTPGFAGESIEEAATMDGDVNVDKLPADIQAQLIVPEEMTEEQTEKLMGYIGDAALQALKKIGIKDTVVYGYVDRIQKAVIESIGPGKTEKKGKKK